MSSTARIPRLTGLGLTAGIALALLARLGHADAPPGHYTLTTGYVLDNKTGLTWQRVPAAPASNAAEAASYCSALVLANLSDWRLPSMKELQTILDDSRYDPMVDSTAFPAISKDDMFWSSSAHPVANNMWLVQMNNGSTPGDESTAVHQVLCVR